MPVVKSICSISTFPELYCAAAVLCCRQCLVNLIHCRIIKCWC